MLKCFWFLFGRLLGTPAKAGLQEWQIRRGLKGELNLLLSLKMLSPWV